MKKRTHWILWPSLAVLIAGGVSAKTMMAKEEVLFTVDKARRQDLRETINANGEIQARSRVNVGTSVTAEIMGIHVKDGQEVKAGDLLVTLDQERFKQQLAQAELGLRSSRQDLENAEASFTKQQSSFRRQESLHQQGLLSSEDFQTAKLARDTADIQFQKAKVAVQQAQAQVALGQDALSKTVIRAAMTGRVTGLKAEKGETAISGQTSIAGAVLMVISDLSELLAEVKVGELEVVRLKPGQSAEIQVDAIPGKVLQGRVLEVASSVDRPTSGFSGQDAQNYKVRILLSGSREDLNPLRPGMSARVAVLVQEVKQALTVPLQAVQERDAKNGGLGLLTGTRPVVFVARDGKVEERSLRPGVGTRRAVQILEGVKEGEDVVTGPAKALTTLATGAQIKVQSEAEALKRRMK
jgi:HlyD family secretion protein